MVATSTAVTIDGIAALTVRTLKALSGSTGLAAANEFCCEELFGVLTAMKVELFGATHTTAGASTIAAHLTKAHIDSILRKPNADAQTWPSASTEALGRALTAFDTTGVAVAIEFPLTAALETLSADSSEWSAFLAESVIMSSTANKGSDRVVAAARLLAERSE